MTTSRRPSEPPASPPAAEPARQRPSDRPADHGMAEPAADRSKAHGASEHAHKEEAAHGKGAKAHASADQASEKKKTDHASEKKADQASEKKADHASEKKAGAKASTALLGELREASKGLLLPSESDAPFTVEALDAEPTPESLRQASGLEADAPVATTTLEALLGALGKESASQDEEERAEAVRWRALQATLSERLRGVRVLRVGQTDVDVWIVGQDEGGGWVALRSHVVET